MKMQVNGISLDVPEIDTFNLDGIASLVTQQFITLSGKPETVEGDVVTELCVQLNNSIQRATHGSMRGRKIGPEISQGIGTALKANGYVHSPYSREYILNPEYAHSKEEQ